MMDENVFSEKKKPNQNPAGAALPLQLLKPVQFICNSSANGSVPKVNDSGDQRCFKTTAVQLMATRFLLIYKGC